MTTTAVPIKPILTPEPVTRASAAMLSRWLETVIAFVFAMIVVGGATRLTDSGLSITEWKPILGVIPPLSDADWQIAFDKYRQIPEYQEINKGMSLAEFQFIYWWEWAHRFLGRFIGLIYALPLLAFVAMGRVPRRMMALLFALLVLGGIQGFVGWYMVQSGLSERVDVSQYRLALHLSIAFVILGMLVWARLLLRNDQNVAMGAAAVSMKTVPASARWVAFAVLVLVFVQVALGAFVAGLKAGLTYNTWPLMDGALIPGGLFMMSPWYVNPFENITTVQFNHRMTAYLLLGLAVWHAVQLARTSDDSRLVTSSVVVALAVTCQAVIGIWTLLAVTGNAIPIGLGLLHQGGAAIVLAITVWHVHRMVHSDAIAS